MVLEKLGSVLKSGMDKLAGAVFVDKKLIDSVIKDLQRVLIESDVNVVLVKQLSDELRKAAVDEKVKGVEKKEHIIKLLHDRLTSILGGESKELVLPKNKQNRIMFVGLNGSGKTTSTNKLAYYFAKRGFKSASVGLDVHRPAAAEQLMQLGKESKITVFASVSGMGQDASKLFKSFSKDLLDYDAVFVDTAGRDALDEDLIKEIKSLDKVVKPTHTFLVIPADIGTVVKRQAQEFKSALDITGVIVTRMDSSAKGGGVLSACAEVKVPVYFITTGEKLNDLEVFDAKRFINRLLGMGDLEGLLERVRSVMDEGTQIAKAKRLASGEFNMLDLKDQLGAMEGMGSLSKLTSMIPGLGKAKISEDVLDSQGQKVKRWKNIIDSMSREELDHPQLLDKQRSRMVRVAKGSSTSTSEVKSLLKQYRLIKEFAGGGDLSGLESGEGLSQKQMQKLMKKFGRKMK